MVSLVNQPSMYDVVLSQVRAIRIYVRLDLLYSLVVYEENNELWRFVLRGSSRKNEGRRACMRHTGQKPLTVEL